MTQFDIVVVGGGMVGQALSLSISKQSDLRIAIIDPTTPKTKLDKEFHLRVSAITPKSEELLSKLQVWDLIDRKNEFVRTKVWDQNSHGRLSFSSKDEGVSHLGHIIENDAIQIALYKSLARTNVKYIKAKLKGIKKIDTGYEVRLNNKDTINCSLLIGADGARSITRELAGIECNEYDYKQKAIICNVNSSVSFGNTTWQRFLSDSIVAILPLSDKRASIVWSAKDHLSEGLMLLSIDDFAERLSFALEYRFGDLEVVSEVLTFPLIERSANEYAKDNLVLVGDAAHNIHPLAGQGVNLGFSDVEELTEQILSSDKPIGNYNTLRKYARSRRFENEIMAKTMTGLNWIYKENNEPLRWLRGIGMNIIDDNQSLKSFFQRKASGN
jgi:2-octaprenyl-3-methyl-6-methoxy-1,4-benzoquinol hydroxylase/2-octaprenylphenol hydroxylase